MLALAVNLAAAETNNPAPLKIGTGEAGQHIDQEMIVTGKVAQVTFRPKTVFLNLDGRFPDSPFSVVIFAPATNLFGDIKSLEGKSVEVKGKIKSFHDKPEMVLESTNQLTVLDTTNAPRSVGLH